MKLPFSLIKKFVETKHSAEELGDLLTMAGFELEGIESVAGEPVLDIKVMANRGDGLSALGLAREILAKDPSSKQTALMNQASAYFGAEQLERAAGGVSIETSNCDRFCARIYEGVQNTESPEWLKKELEWAGLRPISLFVDLTNYVMREIGQPMHAYDLDKLAGERLIARQANEGERLVTLDGVERTLTPEMMVIADESGPVGIAGVMGGQESEVSSTTKRVLLESAHFDNSSVRRTRKALNMNTDASYRFERSVDPNLAPAALNRFDDLVYQITGRRGRPEIFEANSPLTDSEEVVFRRDRCTKLLGFETSHNDCIRILSALGFKVREAQDQLWVTPPTWRTDVSLEEDLIEEIGRIAGYENIPEELPFGHTPRGGAFGLYGVIDTAKKTMLRCGVNQVIAHSLRDESPLDFNPQRRVRVRNPHSPELACLRSSTLPGLADAALRNDSRNSLFFEIGRVFVQGDHTIDESPELGILISGDVVEPHFAQKQSVKADFWTLKGIIMELGKLIRDDVTFLLPRLPDHRFHPTRQAGVLVDQGRLWVGTFGQIHPEIAEQVGLSPDTFLAELDLAVFFLNPDFEVQHQGLSRNPAVRRDIAVLMPKSVDFRDMRNAIRAECGQVLERDWLFDVYEGEGIPDGHHSLGLALQLRKMGENFTDEEANAVRDRAVKVLEGLGGKLR